MFSTAFISMGQNEAESGGGGGLGGASCLGVTIKIYRRHSKKDYMM